MYCVCWFDLDPIQGQGQGHGAFELPTTSEAVHAGGNDRSPLAGLSGWILFLKDTQFIFAKCYCLFVKSLILDCNMWRTTCMYIVPDNLVKKCPMWRSSLMSSFWQPEVQLNLACFTFATSSDLLCIPCFHCSWVGECQVRIHCCFYRRGSKHQFLFLGISLAKMVISEESF